MGVFDEAKDKAKQAIDDLRSGDREDAAEREAEQEAEQEKAAILEEAQQAADEARKH
jgi:hypothetical protein